MTPEDITALFTRKDGSYLCARWGRPIVPVVFGVEDETLQTVKGAIEAIVALAGHNMDETDTELGANLMVFFCREWSELEGVPNLGQLIDGLPNLVQRLDAAGANQYRTFRFDEQGAIKLCIVFVRMDAELTKQPAETIALAQAAQLMLTWSDQAFVDRSPLALANGNAVLRPEIGAVIQAAYDQVMPVSAQDSSHALRLYARTLA
ncbi:hypothetical protein HCZ30_07080 [Marivivens donghaensis]|uniref:Uncharacterized protein n=1 Tax=Marivivens donghaensis TaxID=1699413 RepID=A0ABX0VY65_9RHOB|nr:hypothetical protein [Marivivens donghaensis]NIY72196.1 hypothetical protein [Marivivens donghaensis]